MFPTENVLFNGSCASTKTKDKSYNITKRCIYTKLEKKHNSIGKIPCFNFFVVMTLFVKKRDNIKNNRTGEKYKKRDCPAQSSTSGQPRVRSSPWNSGGISVY